MCALRACVSVCVLFVSACVFLAPASVRLCVCASVRLCVRFERVCAPTSTHVHVFGRDLLQWIYTVHALRDAPNR